MKEEIKLLSENAIVPKRGTLYSACKDIYSPIDCEIFPGTNLLIKTDIAIAWDDPTYYIQILPRSSLSYKHNVVTQAGVIDYDYRQNIGVLLHNNSDKSMKISRGDRIAQYAYIKISIDTETIISDEFTPLQSDRNGGFGSTGK